MKFPRTRIDRAISVSVISIVALLGLSFTMSVQMGVIATLAAVCYVIIFVLMVAVINWIEDGEE